MGSLAAEAIASARDMELSAGVERRDLPDIGKRICGVKVIRDDQPYPSSDVWVDFSLREPALQHIRHAAKSNVPFIMAVTGFNTAEEQEIKRLAKRIPLMLAPNLSVGAAALERLSAQAAVWLDTGFDASIIEIHHKAKHDAPSGTAKRIAGAMKEVGAEAQIVSLRGGGAVGEHQARFIGADEEVVLIHRAWSRQAFAAGVLRAIRFIVHEPPRLYSPRDIFSG